MALPLILFGIVGALIGSFAGVVAERAFTGQSWKTGRSRCNSCRTFLTPRDLVPVVSWVLHAGRCRTCGSKVPGLYALYELSMGIVFMLGYLTFGISIPLFVFLSAITVLAFITIYDLRHTIVPWSASLTFVAISAVFAYISSPDMAYLLTTGMYAAGIALFFFLMYVCSKGRAMGLGDTPMAFGLSLLAGHAALAGFLFSFWVGGVIGICILVFRRGGPKMGIEVPFVPFMVIGFLLALFTQWNPLPF
jgi:prepilin signal peptidase PulO-like enzyme (type II secretory pathway)